MGIFLHHSNGYSTIFLSIIILASPQKLYNHRTERYKELIREFEYKQRRECENEQRRCKRKQRRDEKP